MADGKLPHNLGHQNLKKGKKAAVTPFKVNGTIKKGEVLNPKGGADVLARARQADKDIMTLARESPEAVQEELYAELSRSALRLTRKLNNTGGEPSRALLEAWREVRQAGLVVLEIRRSRGALDEAREFFAEFDQRIEALLGERYDEDLVVSPIADFPEEDH